jgi:hypothetical protein
MCSLLKMDLNKIELSSNLSHFVRLVDETFTGSAKSNMREPKSCFGRVFNTKLGRFATLLSKCLACVQTLLELKTRPRAWPVSLSLSMAFTRSFNAQERKIGTVTFFQVTLALYYLSGLYYKTAVIVS